MRLLQGLLLVCFVCGYSYADIIAVLPFRLAQDAPADYVSFANVLSDSLGTVTGIQTLYLTGNESDADSSLARPDYAAIRASSGATLILSGVMTRANGRPQCSVNLYDVLAGRVCFSYAFDNPEAPSVSGLASFVAPRIALFCPLRDQARIALLSRVSNGSLFVRTNPTAADIFLDSSYAGTSPRVLERIFSGKHRLFLRHAAEKADQDATVRPNRMENVLVTFPSAATSKSDQPSTGMSVVRGISLGGGLAGVGVAIYYYNKKWGNNDTYGLVSACVGGVCLAAFCITFMF
jgi:hypothetical protein